MNALADFVNRKSGSPWDRTELRIVLYHFLFRSLGSDSPSGIFCQGLKLCIKCQVWFPKTGYEPLETWAEIYTGFSRKLRVKTKKMIAGSILRSRIIRPVSLAVCLNYSSENVSRRESSRVGGEQGDIETQV